MQLWHAILLGLVQGLTEFLPVSSTAHLTFTEHLLLGRGMPLAFDVVLHVGTLLALVVYFRTELKRVWRGALGRDAEGRRLLGWLLLAMVPTGILGLATKPWKEWAKNHLWVYGACLLLTALLLFLANRRAAKGGRDTSALTARDALAVGAIQGLGGGFGLSRSGSTICMGVFSGLALPASARFSFLLGIPTIAAAALVESKDLFKALSGQAASSDMAFPGGNISPLAACLVGVAFSAISGYLAIGLLDRFTRSPKLHGFAIYCVALGTILVGLGMRGPAHP